ncbi:MAG: purine-binding chemotaxis protein CheW [Clostridium sp.]|nr:purine-binding chemotaxis protein CheW [Clostridium sp.]
MAEVLEKLKEPENMQEYEEDTQKDKYLTFVIGKEVYGIEIKFVTEIIGIQPITQVPELPNYVKGIINLRGKIVPVIDVRLRFKKEPRDYNDRTCIVVIDIKEISVGLIVDSVAEVVDISEEDIVPPPNTNTGFNNRYIKGIGKMDEQVKLIIDCNEFLDDKQCDNLIDIG